MEDKIYEEFPATSWLIHSSLNYRNNSYNNNGIFFSDE